MYDNFEAFQIIKLTDFTFKPSRFEVWHKGQMVNNGNTTCIIKMQMNEPTEINPSRLQVLISNNNDIIDELDSEIAFDVIFTSTDRIMMTSISNKSNIDNYADYWVFKSSFPPKFQITTREEIQYTRNQPFASALFLSNQRLKKVVFYLGVTQKLIEFYE